MFQAMKRIVIMLFATDECFKLSNILLGSFNKYVTEKGHFYPPEIFVTVCHEKGRHFRPFASVSFTRKLSKSYFEFTKVFFQKNVFVGAGLQSGAKLQSRA